MKKLILIAFLLVVFFKPQNCEAAFSSTTVWEVETTGVDDYITVSAVPAAAGSGYAVGNVLTLSGGTSTTAATFTVASIDGGGGVVTVTATNTGHYTVVPTNAVSTTGGAGTLCTLTVTWNGGGNGGGFDTGVAGFPTDGTTTANTGNTTAPVFKSASYNFVAGDVGAWIYIKSGTNSYPGWYKIDSVASNQATLNGTIGQAVLNSGNPSTAVGIASVGTPTSLTWGIDYSQQAAAEIAFTDMVIDGTTNTKFTSAANPVAKNFIGNIINVTGGTGFTVQRVTIASTSGTTATCDKSLGTLSSTGGTGNFGGALASPGQGALLAIAGNTVYMLSGTYSITSATINIPQGCPSLTAGGGLTFEGYQTLRGDLGTAPILQASSISTATLFGQTGTNNNYRFINLTLDGNAQTAILGFSGTRTTFHYKMKIMNCTNGGGTFGTGQPSTLVRCEATAISGAAAFTLNGSDAYDCEAYSGSQPGFVLGTGSRAVRCIAYGNSGASSDGFQLSAQGGHVINSVAYNNGRDGFRATTGTYPTTCTNCISEGNSGVGFNASAANPGFSLVNCATFNTSNIGANVTSRIINLVTATATFFVSASTGNFALNAIAGQGAACRAAGIPGAFPSGTTTGYLDIGAAQTQGSPGGFFMQ